MRAIIPAREKPRPFPEPLAAAAAANAENPAIDTVDELAVGGQTAAEAGDVGGGVGWGCGEEDRGERTGGGGEHRQSAGAFSYARPLLDTLLRRIAAWTEILAIYTLLERTVH